MRDTTREPIIFNVAFLGCPGVGRSSLIKSLLGKGFIAEGEVPSYKTEAAEVRYVDGGRLGRIGLRFAEAPQNTLGSRTESEWVKRRADILVFVGDVCHDEADGMYNILENIGLSSLMTEGFTNRYSPTPPAMFLVGNKAGESEKKRTVKLENAMGILEVHKRNDRDNKEYDSFHYIETSAKNNVNIKSLFSKLVSVLVTRHLKYEQSTPEDFNVAKAGLTMGLWNYERQKEKHPKRALQIRGLHHSVNTIEHHDKRELAKTIYITALAAQRDHRTESGTPILRSFITNSRLARHLNNSLNDMVKGGLLTKKELKEIKVQALSEQCTEPVTEVTTPVKLG